MLEDVFNEAKYPEVTFVQPKEYPYIKSAFRAEGKHITISGPSGSGKTTLVKRLLQDLDILDSDVLYINGRTYNSAKSCIHMFGDELDIEPTFQVVTDNLGRFKFIIIDDFHYLSYEARKELASKLKLWHEKKVRFIIIGIATSAAEMVGADAELGIRNDPFELKTQDDSFVLKLIQLGENALNFKFSDELKSEIVTASNGVPSIVQVICRNACIYANIDRSQREPILVDFSLRNLKEPVLRIFNAKYFNKVVGLAKGKQQAKSVHNTYFDIISTISKDNRSEIPVEFLYEKIVGVIEDPTKRSRKATSFYNCLHNLEDVIEEKGLNDVLLYSKDGKYISIEDPSFRFYLNLLDMNEVLKRINVRNSNYPYDVAISFAGDIRNTIIVPFIEELTERGISAFYDFDQQAALWGQDLRPILADIYADQAIYMIVFLSESYPEKDWTNFELAIGRNAADKRTSEYLLPVRVDDVKIVGLKDTVCYIDLREIPLNKIADILSEKINNSHNSVT